MKNPTTEDHKDTNLWNKILNRAMQAPFVRVNRAEFLRKELMRFIKPEEIEEAILDPRTKLNKNQLSKIANGCIKYHLTIVCATSALAGLPGGWATLGAIPADITQFYGHIFVLTQKLLYLYGWPELTNEEGMLDDGTAQILTLFTGVMFGSQAATNTTKTLGQALSKGTLTHLPKKALTKYAIYNITKQVGKWIGIKITKDSFARGVSKAIPLIGAPISAGLTYATFKPMANKLNRHLNSLE